MRFLLLFTLLATSFALHNKKALEIHIFSVGQADAQLVVFPSGYSIMIDAGDTNSNAAASKHMAKRIEQILGKKHIDIFVLTHFHGDHFGKKGNRGIWYLVEKAGITFGKFLRRDIGSYNGKKLADCSKSTMTWKYVGQMSDDMLKFICYATSTKEKTKLSKVGQLAYRCNNKQIAPPDSGASVTIIMRDALGVKSSETGKPIARNSINSSTKVSENDYSICMRIVYGKFVYATCGDLSGINYKKSSHKFHNIETKTAPMMGEVDLHKVNHHGSDTSTTSTWCKTLKPTVSVITCGGSKHPNSGALKHLNNVGSKIYTTGKDCCQSTIKKISGVVQMGEEIVVTVPTGSKTFTVAGVSGKNKKTFNIKQNKKAAEKCRALEA